MVSRGHWECLSESQESSKQSTEPSEREGECGRGCWTRRGCSTRARNQSHVTLTWLRQNFAAVNKTRALSSSALSSFYHSLTLTHSLRDSHGAGQTIRDLLNTPEQVPHRRSLFPPTCSDNSFHPLRLCSLALEVSTPFARTLDSSTLGTHGRTARERGTIRAR